MNNCPVCHKEPALLHPTLGVLPGELCKKRHEKNTLPRQFEVISEGLRSERREYAKSIVQPFRDGVLSKEYLELYGDKAVQASEEDKKNAQYVWDDVVNHNNFDYKKSK